jgi:hypothetical protein
MSEDTTDQYLEYKLIESNQYWKAKWFYISNHHLELPKPSGNHLKHRLWWNTESTMQEGIQLPELLKKIKALREAGLRAEHVAFSFMKRRVLPMMAQDTLGYQYMVTETRRGCPVRMSYGPPWAHYLGGYQDRLLGRPLGLIDLRCTAPDGVKHKDYGGEVLG